MMPVASVSFCIHRYQAYIDCSAIVSAVAGDRTNSPEALDDIELDIVLGDFFEDAGEGIGLAKGAYDGRITVKTRQSQTKLIQLKNSEAGDRSIEKGRVRRVSYKVAMVSLQL